MAGAVSSSAPAPWSAPTATAWVRAPPPSAKLAWEAMARWIDDGGLQGGGSLVLG
jgi:hypothetical protein